jgi:hypothetical protein
MSARRASTAYNDHGVFGSRLARLPFAPIFPPADRLPQWRQMVPGTNISSAIYLRR